MSNILNSLIKNAPYFCGIIVGTVTLACLVHRFVQYCLGGTAKAKNAQRTDILGKSINAHAIEHKDTVQPTYVPCTPTESNSTTKKQEIFDKPKIKRDLFKDHNAILDLIDRNFWDSSMIPTKKEVKRAGQVILSTLSPIAVPFSTQTINNFITELSSLQLLANHTKPEVKFTVEELIIHLATMIFEKNKGKIKEPTQIEITKVINLLLELKQGTKNDERIALIEEALQAIRKSHSNFSHLGEDEITEKLMPESSITGQEIVTNLECLFKNQDNFRERSQALADRIKTTNHVFNNYEKKIFTHFLKKMDDIYHKKIISTEQEYLLSQEVIIETDLYFNLKDKIKNN